MPGYVPPTSESIAIRCGLNRHMEGLESGDFDLQIGILRDMVAVRVALRVGNTYWTAIDHSQTEADALAEVVRLGTSAALYRGLAGEELTGTHEPVAMHDSDTMLALADAHDAQADALLIELGFPEPVPPVIPPSTIVGAMPYLVGAGDPGPSSVRPSDRIRDLDERDDIPSGSPVSYWWWN
jgi:hypothetical protein